MVALSKVRKHGATHAGQWACAWVSADRQGSLWMGIGDSEESAIADAKREIAEQGMARQNGDALEAELIEDDAANQETSCGKT